jgi:hypothetical protein
MPLFFGDCCLTKVHSSGMFGLKTADANQALEVTYVL